MIIINVVIKFNQYTISHFFTNELRINRKRLHLKLLLGAINFPARNNFIRFLYPVLSFLSGFEKNRVIMGSNMRILVHKFEKKAPYHHSLENIHLKRKTNKRERC